MINVGSMIFPILPFKPHRKVNWYQHICIKDGQCSQNIHCGKVTVWDIQDATTGTELHTAWTNLVQLT